MRKLFAVTAIIVMAASTVGTTSVQAASSYADPAFEAAWKLEQPSLATHWRFTERYWGPLGTARDGQREPYDGGQRLVQYFDKARMELNADKSVTSGLLTVELTTGSVQTGNTTFERHSPARINVAGDPGSDGVTDADLARAPKKPGPTGNGESFPYSYDPTTGFAVKYHSSPEMPFNLFDFLGEGTVLVGGGR